MSFMWWLLFGTAHALAATTTSLVTLDTRPSVTQKFILIKPDQPVASVILSPARPRARSAPACWW